MIHYATGASVLRDRVFSILKNFREAFPDNFESSGITICESCDGTGLPCRAGWRPQTYCKDCDGFGHKGFERIYQGYVCRSCKGGGCKICEEKGIVDWITHARGG